MPDIDTLRELLARVEKLSGPDRELDLDLARALAPDVVCLRHNQETEKNEPCVYWRYTESVDAAISFMKRVCPEANCYGMEMTPKGADCYVSRNYVAARDDAWIYAADGAPTFPLGLLAATLRALIANAALANKTEGA